MAYLVTLKLDRVEPWRQADVLLTMRRRTPARWMSPFVSGSMVFLLALLALVEPEPDVRVEVKEHMVMPGVTYRVERRWQVVSDTMIAKQADNALADLQIHRPFRAYRKGTWWITKTCSAYWDEMRTWFSNQQLRTRLVQLYRRLPSNWYLSDLGIARNGKPLPIPPALATSIWQHHALRDQQGRAWGASFYPDLLETEDPHVVVIGDDSSDEIDARLEEALARIGIMEADAELFLNHITVDTDGTVEAIYIAPYLLLIRNEALIGVLGGEGRFDRIPAEWTYLRQ